MISFRKKIRIRAAAIIITDGRILLVAHKKNGRVYWLLPGGGVEYGESMVEALHREVKEEIGIDVAVNEPALMCDSIDPSGKRHIINICFLCDHRGGEPVVGSERRLFDCGYFSSDDLTDLSIYPPFPESLKKIMRGENDKIYLGEIWENF